VPVSDDLATKYQCDVFRRALLGGEDMPAGQRGQTELRLVESS